MKLELKKAQLANLTNDSQVLPQQLTPQVAGGTLPHTSLCMIPSKAAPCASGECNTAVERLCQQF